MFRLHYYTPPLIPDPTCAPTFARPYFSHQVMGTHEYYVRMMKFPPGNQYPKTTLASLSRFGLFIIEYSTVSSIQTGCNDLVRISARCPYHRTKTLHRRRQNTKKMCRCKRRENKLPARRKIRKHSTTKKQGHPTKKLQLNTHIGRLHAIQSTRPEQNPLHATLTTLLAENRVNTKADLSWMKTEGVRR